MNFKYETNETQFRKWRNKAQPRSIARVSQYVYHVDYSIATVYAYTAKPS